MFRSLLARSNGMTAGLQWSSTCAVCRAWPAQTICQACMARFAAPVHRCQTCALPLPAASASCGRCLHTPPPLDACFAAVDYAYPWSGLIADFKFRDQPGLARQLALLLVRTPGAADAVKSADLVLPMPLSERRLATRGYNQALLLARQLAPGRVDAGILVRVQDTPPQNQLDRKARLANVRHAFAVEPLQAGQVNGRRILLVDDVMTTGASLHGAALALRQAGAVQVRAAVVARTLEPA